MPDILESYPALGEKISTAREAGYSDEDIQKHIQGKIQTATKAGYSPKEINAYLGDIPKPSISEPIIGTAKGVAETAVSTVPTMIGAAMFNVPGGIAGAGIGEVLRQMIFDDEIKPSTIAFSAATGAIPGLKFAGVAKPGARIALKAAEGGAFGLIGGEGHKAIEKGGDYKFDPEQAAYNALAGMAFGTAFEGMNQRKGAIPASAEAKLRDVAAELADPDKVTAHVKSALQKNYKDLTQTESMALVKAYQQTGAPPPGAPAAPVAAAGPAAPPSGPSLTGKLSLLAGAQHTGESVAQTMGIDLAQIKDLVQAGHLQKDPSTGLYELKSQPIGKAVKATASAIPAPAPAPTARRPYIPESELTKQRAVDALEKQLKNPDFADLHDEIKAQIEQIKTAGGATKQAAPTEAKTQAVADQGINDAIARLEAENAKLRGDQPPPVPRETPQTAPESTIAPPRPQEAAPVAEAQPAPESAIAAPEPEGIALRKEAVETAAKYRDPMDRPMTPAEAKEWEDFVKENRLRQNTEIRDMRYGLIPEMQERLAAGADKPTPGAKPAAEIPASFKSMQTEELKAVMADEKATAAGRDYATRELAKRTDHAETSKPQSLDDRLAALEAENAAMVKDLGLGEKSILDLVKGSTTETGAIGHLTPEQQRAEMIARAHRIELMRRIKEAMGVGPNAIDMASAAAKMKVPYEAFDKLRNELLYPANHFSWENVEPDVLRNRLQEKQILRSVYSEARKQNKPLETIAAQQNIDPKVFKNIVHETKIDDFLETVGGTLRDAQRLNERSKFMLAEAPAVEQTGTIRPGSKTTAREDVRTPADTYRRQISEVGFDKTRSSMLDAIGSFEKLATEQRQLGGGLTAKRAAEMSDQARAWAKIYNKYSDQWFKDRAAWGRIGKAQQRPPIPADLIDFMKTAGAELQTWRNHPARTPIYTSLWDAVRHPSELTPSERYQAQNNAVDAVRLNLFPVTSWTLDTMLNAAELGTQHLTAIGADMGYAMQTGKLTMPNTKAIGLAWNNATKKIRNRMYSPEFEEGIGFTAGAEPIPGNVRMRDLANAPKSLSDLGNREYWSNFFKTGKQGAFTERSNQASAALDTLSGSPMYMKGAADSAFKRFSGSMSIYADALKAADAAGVKLPLERDLFVKDYWSKLPKDALDRAITAANAAGFNRQLPQVVERMARSKMGQLFVDAFGRFSWQFLRWTGDMLGADPKVWRKISAGTITPEETMRYLTRAATGIGGIALIDGHFYDKTDFNSLEKVDEQGDRMRLAGREPIASALFLSALVRGAAGDSNAWEKAKGAARFTSFPFMKFLMGGGDGGLASNLMKEIGQSAQQGKDLWSDKVRSEAVDLINHAIPGQAVLSALKAAIDPVVREGIGANLPGVSMLKDPKIDLTTGEPLEVTQRMPITGLSMRSIQGTPIPGMYRELNPVQQMLSRYGIMTYRGNRLPLAGETPSDVSDEGNREWQTEFGKMRDQLQSKLVPIIEKLEAKASPDQLQPKAPLYEAIRAKIRAYDAMAAREAKNRIEARAGVSSKPPRKTTPREERMPNERFQ